MNGRDAMYAFGLVLVDAMAEGGIPFCRQLVCSPSLDSRRVAALVEILDMLSLSEGDRPGVVRSLHGRAAENLRAAMRIEATP